MFWLILVIVSLGTYLKPSQYLSWRSLVCGLQQLTNDTNNSILEVTRVLDPGVQIEQSCRTVVLTLFVSALLLAYLISDNWKYPKTSTLLQLKYSTFVYITLHFPHLHHSVTLWLFIDFSRVLGIPCSSSKQTLFTSKLTGSYWNTTKAVLLK